MTSAGLAALPVVDTTNHAAVILDPDGLFGAPQVVYVTAHTAAATTATITAAAQEGTTARAHNKDVPWIHGPTLRDHTAGRMAFARRASTNIVVNGTSWANLDTGLDLVVPNSYAGDIVEVGASGDWVNEGVTAFLDAVSLVSAAPVNSWGSDAAPDNTHEGVLAWNAAASAYRSVGGSVLRRIVAGDLSGATLTLRLRVRTGTAANKTLRATVEDQFAWYAINHGPQEA